MERCVALTRALQSCNNLQGHWPAQESLLCPKVRHAKRPTEACSVHVYQLRILRAAFACDYLSVCDCHSTCACQHGRHAFVSVLLALGMPAQHNTTLICQLTF